MTLTRHRPHDATPREAGDTDACPPPFFHPKGNVAGMRGGIICVSHNDTRAATRTEARDAEETHIMRLYTPTPPPRQLPIRQDSTTFGRKDKHSPT